MKKRVVTLQSVADAAATLADDLGYAQLTLALLAARLDIKPPSLYNHVQGLPAVRRLLLLRGLQEMAAQAMRAAVGKQGPAALQAIAYAMRDFARARPGLYAATVQAHAAHDPEVVAAAQEALRPFAQVLADSGLQGDEAIHALRTFRSAVHGFIELEAGGFGLPTEISTSFAWMVRRLCGLFFAAQPEQNSAV